MEIFYFESIPSTNSSLLEKSKKNAKSWTVYWTKNQTKGRGYAGNVWESEVNENLAFSVLIKCGLDYAELIYFNQWVSVVLAEYFASISDEVYVKWPNDIIVKDKKICGVLIETHRLESEMNVVVGIGVNVNQSTFDRLSSAGSLYTQIGEKYDVEEILSDLLTELRNKFSLIQKKSWELIRDKYNSRLFKKDILCEFEVSGEKIKGEIKSVDHDGNLNLKLESGEMKVFKTKEIKMIY